MISDFISQLYDLWFYISDLLSLILYLRSMISDFMSQIYDLWFYISAVWPLIFLPGLVEFLFWPLEELEGAALFLSDPDADPAITVT